MNKIRRELQCASFGLFLYVAVALGAPASVAKAQSSEAANWDSDNLPACTSLCREIAKVPVDMPSDLNAYLTDKLQFVAIYQTSTPAVASYTYTTTRDDENGHFVVEITSSSAAPLLCSIDYSGHSFLNTDRQGSRVVPVRAAGSSGNVVSSIQFGGFRTFVATVSCIPKQPKQP